MRKKKQDCKPKYLESRPLCTKLFYLPGNEVEISQIRPTGKLTTQKNWNKKKTGLCACRR